MGTRFNSFYHDELHPFVESMIGVLAGANARAMRPESADYIFRAQKRKFEEDIAYLHKVAKELVQKRRENPSDKKDLLNAMLKNRDPKLGVELSDESVVNNMVTFLVAGILPSPSLTMCSITDSSQDMRRPLDCCPFCSTNSAHIQKRTTKHEKKSTPSSEAAPLALDTCPSCHILQRVSERH